MRLWPKRRARPGEGAAPVAASTLDVVETAPSPETMRALAAARTAAMDLHEARRLRSKIDRRADEIDADTSKNGFVPLIRQAFGSGS